MEAYARPKLRWTMAGADDSSAARETGRYSGPGVTDFNDGFRLFG